MLLIWLIIMWGVPLVEFFEVNCVMIGISAVNAVPLVEVNNVVPQAYVGSNHTPVTKSCYDYVDIIM